ncbi:MAG: type IV pilin protein, partial [Solimonas sp.]
MRRRAASFRQPAGQEGFSLIELMIAITILAILLGIAVPS